MFEWGCKLPAAGRTEGGGRGLIVDGGVWVMGENFGSSGL